MKSKILIYLISSIILLAGIIAPAAYLVYNSNPGLESLFFNSTENSNATGIRLSAPVLFMDFNLNSETTEQNGIRNNYIEDNSLYDNLGLEGMGTESVSNGDMESASVWSAYSSPTSQARSNEQAHSGTYSWKVVSPSGYKGFNQTLTLTSGKTYLLSYWIKNSSGVGGYCAILNSSGANTYNIQPSPITGGWDYVQQSITPNTAATNIIFLSPGGAATFYIDDVSIRENSRPTKNSTGGYDGSGAYMFDGVNDYMVIPSSSILSGTTKTLSIWVKLMANTSSGNNGMLFLGKGGENWMGYNYTAGNCISGRFLFMVYNGSTWKCSSSTTIPQVGVWYQLSGVYDGTSISLYVDGVLENTTLALTPQVPTTSNSVMVGHSSIFVNGSLDQVLWFNRVLNSAEVLCLYNGTGCEGKNNSEYIGKYSSSGDYKSLVFYNSTKVLWNASLNIADTASTRTGIVNDRNEINLSYPTLVSYWKLDGDYLDATSRNNGTCVSGACPNNASGLSSAAMRFDGVNDYVRIGASSSLNNQQLTQALWFKTNSPATTQYLIGNYDWTSGVEESGTYLGIVSSKLKYGENYFPAQSIIGPTTIDPNWHFAIVASNSSNIYFYLDGILINSSAQSNSSIYYTSKDIFMIGAVNSTSGGTGGFFNGTIDEVLIYNSSLTAAEITRIYKSGLSQHANTNITLQTRTASSYNTSDFGLVGLWGLNGNANDELGKNNCTVSGAIVNENGTVGQSYLFDGNDDVLSCGDASFWNGISSFSFSFWAKPAALSTTYITRGSPHNSYGVILYDDASSLLVVRIYPSWDGSSYGQFQIGRNNITLNAWNHIVTSVNLGTEQADFYINGVNISDTKFENVGGMPASLIDTADVLTFGNRPNLGQDYNGAMDEIRIYNRTLSASEVQDLYNLGSYHLNWNDWSSESTCYDNSTQILTEKGWKLFSELKKDDKVATLNPETKEIEYNIPSEYQEYNSPEFMYKIMTEEGELVISPEHRVYSNIKINIFKIIGVLLILIGVVFFIVYIINSKR